MPHVGFEPTIPVFERAKTVYALVNTATVTGEGNIMYRHTGLQYIESLILNVIIYLIIVNAITEVHSAIVCIWNVSIHHDCNCYSDIN
jgi:hypothetical protein